MGKAFDEIHEGLTDAIKHSKGKKSKVIAHTPEEINVKAIREKTGMSQQRFCAAFGISLKVVQKNPKAVIKAISE